jgi:hypothetical protein
VTSTLNCAPRHDGKQGLWEEGGIVSVDPRIPSLGLDGTSGQLQIPAVFPRRGRPPPTSTN